MAGENKKGEGKTLRQINPIDQEFGSATTAATAAVSTATATTAVATTAAAVSATAAAALFTLLGFVDLDLAAVDGLAVQLFDGRLGGLIGTHGYDAEAAGLDCFAIHWHAHFPVFTGRHRI